MDAARHGKAGFTLVELMVASTVAVILLTALVSSFIGSMRMMAHGISSAELAIRTRELREKLLFHAAPEHDGVVWAGLLSGGNANVYLEGNGEKVLLRGTALKDDGARTRDQEIQLVFREANTEHCMLWSEDRYDERFGHRWLHPGGLDFFAGASEPGQIFVRDRLDEGRFYINVTARKTVAGFTASHNERIVVPVFGRVQRTESDGTGGLGR